MAKKIMKIIAIIPARGGSKGIPGKNIKMLDGKPLISYIIQTALKVKEIDRVIVSTEDIRIAKIAKRYKAEIPFIRPVELAKDDVPTLPVLQHAVTYLESQEHYKPDIIVLLYATSPLISPEKIKEGLNKIKKEHLDSVISAYRDHGHYWIRRNNKFKRLYPVKPKNRQYIEPLLKENGAFYISTYDTLMKKKKVVDGRVGFVIMDRRSSIDIDDLFDFEVTEFLIKRKAKI